MSVGIFGNLFSSSVKYVEINGITYLIDSDASTAAVTKSRNATGDIVILSEIEGVKVTVIGNYAFSGCKGITSVVIPDGVTSVGHSAFKGCKELTNIFIPGSVRSFASGCFSGCTNLKKIFK